jgi:hypothetical protein
VRPEDIEVAESVLEQVGAADADFDRRRAGGLGGGLVRVHRRFEQAEPLRKRHPKGHRRQQPTAPRSGRLDLKQQSRGGGLVGVIHRIPSMGSTEDRGTCVIFKSAMAPLINQVLHSIGHQKELPQKI